MAREIKYYDNKRADLIKFIPRDAKRILDVGCGTGAMGEAIKKARGKDIEIVGIEVNPAVTCEREGIDKVIIGNVEEGRLAFDTEYFDCIVYGDILEHLVNPWELVKKHCKILKLNGRVIASIPNIAHYRVIKMLRNGEWNYQDAGIMDKSHIRFFTLKSMKDMFKKADLDIVKVENKIGASKARKIISKIFINRFLDAITEQYIIVAKKTKHEAFRV